MNPIDLVDLKAFNEDSLLFEIVSSQENSAYNSFANDEMDCIPTEFEQDYFDELSKVLGEDIDDIHDEIIMLHSDRAVHNETLNENPFHVNINEWTSINSLMPFDIHQGSDKRNSLFAMNSMNTFSTFNTSSINSTCSINSYSSINSIAVEDKADGEMKEKVSLKWRTQPCAYFQANGFCKKGDKCNFSHEIPHQSVKPFVPADQLYRTKPCHFFFTTGVCRKGENCNFSHDPLIFEKAGGTTSPTQEE